MVYATLDDLERYTGAQPADGAERQLERASDLLDECLVSVYYTTDASGNPSDATILGALNKACCAQVEHWTATGDELGLTGQFKEMDLGPAKLVREDATQGGSAWGRLCDRAFGHLKVGGVYPGRMSVYLR